MLCRIGSFHARCSAMQIGAGNGLLSLCNVTNYTLNPAQCEGTATRTALRW
jgi:hypothetical protein